MFMIIAVHADYWAIGIPTKEDLVMSPIATFARVFIEQLTVVGVNIFVLISGWFGIKPTAKSFTSICFQTVFYLLGVYTIGVAFGLTNFSIKQLATCFLFTHKYWFIKAYIALVILAPVLNIFVENVKKTIFRNVLIFLFTFQFIYGWLNQEVWIAQGYSGFSFIALYLLARYLRIYGIKWLFSISRSLYIVSCIVATLIALIGIYGSIQTVPNLMVSYVSPFVIAGAIGLLINFEKLNLSYSPLINKIAKSTFAVYLFPCFYISDYIYHNLFIEIYNEYDGIMVIVLFTIILITLYLISVLIDQFRLSVWNWFWKYFEKLINNRYISNAIL
ncbi:MAG: acyltransferase [Paramuribaculum sp.]|nr:acyltransferase [Paramuribaculum sp.]